MSFLPAGARAPASPRWQPVHVLAGDNGQPGDGGSGCGRCGRIRGRGAGEWLRRDGGRGRGTA